MSRNNILGAERSIITLKTELATLNAMKKNRQGVGESFLVLLIYLLPYFFLLKGIPTRKSVMPSAGYLLPVERSEESPGWSSYIFL